MDNILSYIRWRGDLSIIEKTFNEVDNLIFSVLSYIDFGGIVPGVGEDKFITLKDVYRLIFMANKEAKQFQVHGALDLSESFFEKIACSKRFGSAKFFNYKDICDDNLQIQFAALHIELDDGTVYIAFRGTDETILGWREDFAMSFQTVPAQKEAVKYLEQTMLGTNKKYRIGGHSKGGNLAVYASMMCEETLKNQIIEIYNNDGPGFSKEMLETQRYESVSNRIVQIIPQFSVIGMLFEHREVYKIVKSGASGIMQHDAMTWEVEGDHFLEAEDLMPECKVINRIFDTWLEDVNIEQRKIFTKNFFDALEAGGAKKLNDVANGGITGFESILVNMVSSEKETKIVAYKLIKSIVKSLKQINLVELCERGKVIKSTFIAFLGLFFMVLSECALQVVGTVLVFVVLFFSVRRVIYRTTQKSASKIVNRYIKAFYIVVISLIILFILQKNIFIFSSNFSLGGVFIINGVIILKNVAKCINKNEKLWWMPLARALLSIIFGVVALVTSNRTMKMYVFVIGSFMIIEGLCQVIAEMHYCRNI